MTPGPRPHTPSYFGMQNRMKVSKCDVNPSETLNQSCVVTVTIHVILSSPPVISFRECALVLHCTGKTGS